jgi:hypothetical protein
MAVRRRHKRGANLGKKIVYATPYRNLAVEIKRMYEMKGERAMVEAECGEDGQTMYVVCIYPR